MFSLTGRLYCLGISGNFFRCSCLFIKELRHGTFFHKSARRGEDPVAGYGWLPLQRRGHSGGHFLRAGLPRPGGGASRHRHTQAESIGAANYAVRQGQQELAPHLDHIRKMAEDSGVEIEAVVVGSNKPEQTIVEQARLREADVILMGRHGKTGPLSLLVGKMTAKVIAQGFPRVLVAPKDFIITGSHVLVAVNDSANSRQAMQEALKLGRTCTTLQRMTVMAVVDRVTSSKVLNRWSRRSAPRASRLECVLPFEPLVLAGDPADRIIEAARKDRWI